MRNEPLGSKQTWQQGGVLAWLGLIILPAVVCLRAAGQGYSIDWSTIDDGGGTSTGGVYSVSGTIGQPDAGGVMSSGNFSLTGGFWSLYALQTSGAPLLRIFLTNNTAVVAWPAPSTGFTLQVNTNLATTNWVVAGGTVNVVGSENQVVVSPPSGNRYYRLKSP